MVDLVWKTLGYDYTAVEIATGLTESTDISLIQGPPGVGKSWLAKGVGALWESASGGVVVAEGDSSKSDISLHPFGIAAMKAPNFGAEQLATAVGALAKAAETVLLGTGGLLTTTIEALAKRQTNHRRKRAVLLDDLERDVLIRLAKLGRRRPLLLIADNLHWWDETSFGFLTRLRDDRMVDAFPFLADLRVLAVETPEPYEHLAHPQAHVAFLRPGNTRTTTLARVPRVGFEDILVGLGAPQPLPPTTADLVHRFSGGHLILARQCAERLRDTADADFLSAKDPDEFVHGLLGERIRSMGPAGEEAMGVLRVAAVCGLSFRRDAVVCGAQESEAQTMRLLRFCSDEDLVELDRDTGRFVHDFYRRFFLEKTDEDVVTIHEVLGDCMRTLAPGDYDERCINALESKQEDVAAALAVQAALQRMRDGQPWRVLPERMLQAMEDGALTGITELFESAFDHQQNYRAETCLSVLAELPHQLPARLVAEADYLRTSCMVTTRSERDRRDAQLILESWEDYVTSEPELGLRLMRLRLYHLALQADKEPGLRLEGEIRRILRERQSYDKAAEDELYTLDRLAGARQRGPRALDMNRRAVKYYGPGGEAALLRRPVEYYLSLVNLGAGLVGHAMYDEACEIHRLIDRLVHEYEPGVFPRLDYAKTNSLLGEHRAGTVTIDEAVRRQQDTVAAYKVPDDPFFVENALAVYLAIRGSFSEALAILNAVSDQLAARGDPEPSLVYLIDGNCTTIRFLSGERIEADWAALESVVAAIPYDSCPEMVRRHGILAGIFAGEAVDPREFHESALKGRDLSPELCTGFWLPAIEWWR